MRCIGLLFACVLSTFCVGQAPLTADEIMSRVAANQDRAEILRQQYVYEQHVHVDSKLSNGKLMREDRLLFGRSYGRRQQKDVV